MVKILEAVYEDGVFKPLADPGLMDHQKVIVEIRLPAEALGPDDTTLLGPDLTHAGDDVVLPAAEGPAFSLHALPALAV